MYTSSVTKPISDMRPVAAEGSYVALRTAPFGRPVVPEV